MMKKIKEKQLFLLKRMALVGCSLTITQFFFFFFFIKVSLFNYLNGFLFFIFALIFKLSTKNKLETAKAIYFSISIPFIMLLGMLFPTGGMEIYYIPCVLLLYLLYDVKSDKIPLSIFFTLLFTCLTLCFYIRNKFEVYEFNISPFLIQIFYVLNVLFSIFLTAFAGYNFAYSTINAEEKYNETEAKLLAMFESSVESIFLIDTDMKLQWFNKRSINDVKLALGKDLIIGSSVLDYISPNFKDIYIENFNKAIEGNTVEYDRQIITPSGETVFYQINFVPVYNSDQKLIGITTKGLDVTQQYKERERELSLTKLRKQIIQNQLKQKNLGLIIHGQELERQRISEELHSGLAQNNSLLKMQLFGFDKLAEFEQNERIQFMNNIMDEIDYEIQRISNALMPGTIKDLGLFESLENLLKDIHINCSFVFADDVREYQWTEKQKISIFRIFEEIVSIVIKTKSIKSSEVIFSKSNKDSFLLEITFVTSDKEDPEIPIKLNNMTIRAELIHAKVALHQKNHISIVTITIPLNYNKILV